MDPSATALWMNLAKAHRLGGDDEAERIALEQALAIDQLHLMALIRLAELHERLGQIGAATDRWTMVLGLCAQIPDPTPQLIGMINHARAFVAGRQHALAEAVETDLSDALGSASERDRRRATAAAELMVGRRKIFTSQCHGFFYPFLPADEFFDREHFPWLARLEAATADIREELEAI
jgi:aspartate beta-hydroxylase